MEKLSQIGKEFGLEGEKMLEFVEKQQKLEEEREEKRQKRLLKPLRESMNWSSLV